MSSFGENVQNPQFLTLVPLRGTQFISFILITCFSPTVPFFFPQCGHTLLNLHYFRFDEHLQKGHIQNYE